LAGLADLGLPADMRERRSGQIVNVSTLGVRTGAPRFSAYIASKAVRFGSLTELGRTISPAVKEILGASYRAFPDSAATHGKLHERESASALQRTLAQLLRGARW
jgi:hypothetical protein